MSTMQGEVYEALRSINIAEDKAIKAAEAISKRDQDVSETRRDTERLTRDVGDLKADVGVLKRDGAVLKWMVGSLYPLVLAILLKLFLH
jgi:hypothetical protein